jgi:hypothetical protein
MSFFIPTMFLGAAAMAAGAAWAQSRPSTQTPAQQPAPAYRSAFEGYRPFEAGEVQDWRQSNATVGEIGGWRAYAREIQAGGSPASVQSEGARPPTDHKVQPVDPHRGHHQ